METRKYNCLVVDDEPIARRIVVNYIEQTPLLRVSGECINALSAIDYLRIHSDVDIVFLDINMPNLSGLQLLKILPPLQPVIFTTAYAEFAVESYELNAVDYLLKPFSFERFTKAAYKAVTAVAGSGTVRQEPASEKRQLFIKSDGKRYPVRLEDILYCEAKKNYTMVVLKDGRRLMPLIPLSKFDAVLSEAGGGFVQIHRSFLVAMHHVAAVSAAQVTVGKFELPIGVQFREGFYKTMGMNEHG